VGDDLRVGARLGRRAGLEGVVGLGHFLGGCGEVGLEASVAALEARRQPIFWPAGGCVNASGATRRTAADAINMTRFIEMLLEKRANDSRSLYYTGAFLRSTGVRDNTGAS